MKFSHCPYKILLQIVISLICSFHLGKANYFDTPFNQVYNQDEQINQQIIKNDKMDDCCFPEESSLSSLDRELLDEEEINDEIIQKEDEIVKDDTRSSRNRRYPQHLDPNPFFPFWIRAGDCPLSSDGARQHFCPSPTSTGKWVCIDDFQLCDGTKNCPNAEDESRHYCLFYNVLKSEVELLTRSISALSPGVSIPLEDGPQGDKRFRTGGRVPSWGFLD